jgi:hypothetical protein
MVGRKAIAPVLRGTRPPLVGVVPPHDLEIVFAIARHAHVRVDADVPSAIVDIGESERDVGCDGELVETGLQVVRITPACLPAPRPATSSPALRNSASIAVNEAARFTPVDRHAADALQQARERPFETWNPCQSSGAGRPLPILNRMR